MHDLAIMRVLQDLYKGLSYKKDCNSDIPDHGPIETEYPNNWEMFTEKAYIRNSDSLRFIHPRFKLSGGMLCSEAEQELKII